MTYAAPPATRSSPGPIEGIVARAEALYHDLEFRSVRDWKRGEAGRKVIGYLPVFVPVELVTAAGMLPLGIVGGGDGLEIIRGDAFFQSYICHLPRSVVELGVSGRLDVCDGFLFPSTCDVIRNLSGVWKLQFPDKYVRYFDVPQNFDPDIGGRWLAQEIGAIRADLETLGRAAITDDEMWRAIRLHDRNRELLRELYELRCEEPWKTPCTEVYLVQRAGLVLPVQEHNEMLAAYLEAASRVDRPVRDHARIVLSGAFCEQPPLGLLSTLERAGCYIVDDDLLLGPRFFIEPVADGPTRGDPVAALIGAFLRKRADASFVYAGDAEKGAVLAELVESRRAEGVIFAAPSFCDPALLERPMLVKALEKRDISYITMKYAENTGQFQTIREQAGTFADSLKLWS